MKKLSKRFLIFVLAALLSIALGLALWVMSDDTMSIQGDEINLISNPNFDYLDENGQRSFEFWEVGGCASLVRPPKEGAFKAGPTSHDGECGVGDTAVVTQTLPIISGTNTISFTMQPLIVGSGNRLTVTFSDGEGWEWIPYDRNTQVYVWEFTPVVTTTLPWGTDYLTVEIEALYVTKLGTKVRGVTVLVGD